MSDPRAAETAATPQLVIGPAVTKRWIETTFIRFYADTLLADEATIDVTVASNRHPDRVRVQALPGGLRGQDLLDLMIRMFRLPATHTFEDQGFRVFLSYSLKRAGRAVADEATLTDLASDDPNLCDPDKGLTFCTRMVYQELRRQAPYNPTSPEEARARELAHTGALEAFEGIYNQAWRDALDDLCGATAR